MHSDDVATRGFAVQQQNNYRNCEVIQQYAARNGARSEQRGERVGLEKSGRKGGRMEHCRRTAKDRTAESR